MISSVTKEIDGRAETLKLGARAMQAIEQRFDAGFPNLMQKMQSDYRVGFVLAMIEECLNNGAGGTPERAADIVDAIGLTVAAEFVTEIVEAAFPEAKEAPKKNAKRAGR